MTVLKILHAGIRLFSKSSLIKCDVYLINPLKPVNNSLNHILEKSSTHVLRINLFKLFIYMSSGQYTGYIYRWKHKYFQPFTARSTYTCKYI